jgi:hypothetical protein
VYVLYVSIHVCVCVCVYVCMYVHIYLVCMPVRMHVCSMYVRTYGDLYIVFALLEFQHNHFSPDWDTPLG